MFEPGADQVSVAPEDGFQDLFDNAPCGYLVMQLDGRITRANLRLATWIGQPAEQLVGKRLHDLLTVGTRIFYETSFAPQLSLNGACDEMSFDLRTSTGEKIAVSASGQVRKDASGQPLSIRLAFFMATERRRYERQIVDAHSQLEGRERTTQGLLDTERETAELREQFIAVLGHDLRNPLASISGGLRLIQKDQPAERRKLIFDALAGSVTRMAVLIDNVLDFARGRLGAGIPVEFRPDVMLNPVLEHVVAELRLGAPDRVIEIDLDLPAPVRCDPSRIEQLVSNLLGNALTHGDTTMPISLHADQTEAVLTIWVSNGGDPIPPAAVERLFQPFFRGEVRASQQGLGLGLHIASEIAKAHGGTLTASSTAEETRFTFQMLMTPAV
ncbi:PAS domain-containing sensor histidine kinase [Acidisoma silvae]|uniref:histidine kinase n=1 Tax=Acidisoma silvae TaxID=2802396 RepID=A0A964E152_9PROT|nr:PAS domain-containing sensor histidine kinase [Acidisoma silvae]MCB8878220.1 PAS domain-containing sensor histidine kinase [Acidisoma silvae]